MKKILILALVAIVAGAAFAETDPVFSGEIEVYWAYQFAQEDLADSATPDVLLELNAVVDDFNTVAVEIELDDAAIWTDAGAEDGVVQITEISNQDKYLRLANFTLTTDWTGIFGVDGPVAVSTDMGLIEFEAAEVYEVAPYTWEDLEGNAAREDIGIVVIFDIMDMATLKTVLYPDALIDDEDAVFGFTLEAMGIAGMVDVDAYYIKDEGEAVDNLGASVAATIDALSVGAGFRYDLEGVNSDGDDGVAGAQLDVGYMVSDALNAGLSFATLDFTDFLPASAVVLSAEYMLTEKITLGVAGSMYLGFTDDAVDFDAATHIGYDVGLTVAVSEGLTMKVGAADRLDFVAFDDGWDDAVYVGFTATF